MAFSIPNPEPAGEPEDGAVRLWLSQRQWMSILEGTERTAREAREQDEARVGNEREHPRLPAPQDARCLIRLGTNTDDHGTYLVKLRDVSATGLGFNSAHPFETTTRCTVALQDPAGHGMVCAARVVWCRQLENGLNDVGIQFDQPIDPFFFVDPDPDVPC